MLQFLQTGKVLYMIAGVCTLGMLSKLVTSSLYKRLIKETGNMALTKNRNLKALKQRTENMFLLGHGIRNTQAYIEKQMYGFRFMHVSLDSWDNLSLQAMILCFLIGGAAAFASYWCRSDSYYIVLYGSMGILSGLLLVFVDNGANIALKRQQLADSLTDYVENSPHFYKNVDNTGNGTDKNKKSNSDGKVLRPRLREWGRKTDRGAEETAAGEETIPVSGNEKAGVRTGRFHIEDGATDETEMADETENARNRRQGGRFSVLSRKKDSGREGQETDGREKEAAGGPGDGKPKNGGHTGTGGPAGRSGTEGSRSGYGGAVGLAGLSARKTGTDGYTGATDRSGDDELTQSIEHLRQSLEQIAAGREQIKKEAKGTRNMDASGLERAGKELNPEDIKLLGELLQEYLT